jgi:hypothetical protein
MIFTLKNQIPYITPEGLTIPEILNIWKSGKDESLVQKRLCYIYHMADPKSVYSKLSEDDREKTVLKDFFGDIGYKPVKEDKLAIEKYKKLNETVTLRYLKATESAMDKIAGLIHSSTIDLDNMKDILSAIEKGEKLITSYSKLIEQVEKEISATRKIRGGVKPNMFDNE